MFFRWQQAWWKRDKVREYFPVYTKDNQALEDYLRSMNIFPSAVPVKFHAHPTWKLILDNIRILANQIEASILLWSIFTAGCAIIITTTRANK